MKKIAVFGGKFDPPHLAHQLVIFLLLTKHAMDEVWVVPSFSHPFGFKPAPFDQRLELCRLLIAPWQETGKVHICADESKIESQPVFTIDLMHHFYATRGTYEYFLAIGEDNWKQRTKWKDFDQLAALAKPLIIGRGLDYGSFFPLPDISSTYIRTLIKNGENPDHLLPAGVSEFIREKGLYV